jgi:DHA1 family bicyclomycin/chloramphenicol resistance-like MFS transporter
MDLYLPSLPQLADSLDTTASLAQLTMTACLIGLGFGQLLFGPLSDRFGRRVPLIIGVAAFTIFSLASAFAPTIWLLLLFRFLQGLGGAAGVVIAAAAVRDLYSGRDLARMFSLIVMVSGTAPIVAPLIGGWLTLVTDWRGIFLVLSGAGAALLALAVFGVSESLPVERRSRGGLLTTVSGFRLVVKDRVFVTMLFAVAATTGGFVSYLTMSSFVFQDEYGLTPVGFSLVFALNSVAFATGAHVNGRLTRRFATLRLLRFEIAGAALACAGLLASALSGAPIVVVAACITITLLFYGGMVPNMTALALEKQSEHAGSASAVLGGTQFIVGPLVGPIVSTIAVSAVTLGATMVAGLVLAFVIVALLLPVTASRQR